jgi:hypothetical protein
MDALTWLQRWYWRHCDGDWEHGYGLTIEAMDNPGWSLRIELTETELEAVAFESVEMHRSEYDWFDCSVVDKVYQGYCGAQNLAELISVFRAWATPYDEPPDIFTAITHGDLESVKDGVASDPNRINEMNEYGVTPLYDAVVQGEITIARFLLEHKADVNKCNCLPPGCNDSDGPAGLSLTPIFAAVTGGCAMTELLLQYGANLDATDANRQTPLHWAVSEPETDETIRIVELLLQHRADPDARDKDGETPIDLASRTNNTRITHLLSMNR